MRITECLRSDPSVTADTTIDLAPAMLHYIFDNCYYGFWRWEWGFRLLTGCLSDSVLLIITFLNGRRTHRDILGILSNIPTCSMQSSTYLIGHAPPPSPGVCVKMAPGEGMVRFFGWCYVGWQKKCMEETEEKLKRTTKHRECIVHCKGKMTRPKD